MSADDTIVAIASPPGGAARGIVRLSGDSARALASQIARAVPEGRGVSRTRLHLPGDLVLPALLYQMPGPGSYTGEDVVEIHLPGSPPVLRHLVDTLVGLGARPARPGEFTQRAYLHGRMDLSQAEAVQSVIQAGNLDEVRAARRQLEGFLSRPLGAIEEHLLDLCADVEASIDFVDQDIEIVSSGDTRVRLDRVRDLLDELLSHSRLETGTLPVVALYGAPNAGKSTLFNRLTGGDALVSERAGTTRDVLAGEMDRIRILDVAGEQRADGVDGEAVERARRAREEADLVLLVVDASAPGTVTADGRPTIFVANKIDSTEPGVVETLCRTAPFVDRVGISAKTGEGVERLRGLLRHRVESGGDARSARFQVTVRQQAHLRQGRAALEEAGRALDEGRPVELVALDLRAGLESLGAVSGRQVSEEILDRIFSRFCLGK